MKEYLPLIRAATARILIRDHKFSQVKVASALGITQAAVSGYVNTKATKARSAQLSAVIEELGAQLAREITKRDGKPVSLSRLCQSCECNDEGQIVCQINRKHAASGR